MPMNGFEPWTSDVGSNRSSNWATTTSQKLSSLASHLKLNLLIFDAALERQN